MGAAAGSASGARCRPCRRRAKRPKLGPAPDPGRRSAGRSPRRITGSRARGSPARATRSSSRADAKVREDKTITLNTNVFTEERGPDLGLTPKQMVAWEKERRVCHLVQYELADRTRYLVANLHATPHCPISGSPTPSCAAPSTS